MAARNFIKEKIRISKPLQLALIAGNSSVLLINLFVGLLVYQNPLIALTDLQNVLCVILFGTGLPLSLYLGYKLAVGIGRVYRGVYS